MKTLPPTTPAWVLTLTGIGMLLLSIAIHWRMILVELGIEPVAAGGGEYMVALFGGLPCLLLSCLLLGIAALRTRLRSLLALVPFFLSVAGILAWLVAFAS